MGTEASLGRRAGTVARWPVGMGLAFWRYLWRTMPLHRSDEEGSPDRDLPPPLPDGVAGERLQRLEDGSGPLFRRRYRVRIEDGRLRFEIESWARSGDRLSNLLYHHLRMAKEIQLHMWTHFCERAAKLSGGRIRGGISIDTRRVEVSGAHGR